MNKLKSILVLFFCGLTSIVMAQNTMEGKNILIVYGGWEGHQPEVFAKKIASWLEEQNANVSLSKSTTSYVDKTLMESLDLVIQHVTMSQISDEESEGLRKAIASGVGLAGCHGGLIDSFRNDTEYQYMVGGQFVKHPGGQIKYKVNISNKTDPITQDINDFELTTEQYYIHFDPIIEILATTKFTGDHDEWIEGIEMPVVWKKTYGKGKVFYSALGHSADVFEIPEAWSLMTRGVEWAAK